MKRGDPKAVALVRSLPQQKAEAASLELPKEPVDSSTEPLTPAVAYCFSNLGRGLVTVTVWVSCTGFVSSYGKCPCLLESQVPPSF